jgi:transcriptional regulator with XRE-family HTH domain
MTESPISNATDLRTLRGQALKQARQLAGLSARELADRVNDRTRGSDLTHNAIYAYERGKVLLGHEAAHRLAEVLKMPVGELLIGDPDYAGQAPTAESTDATAIEDLGDDRLRLARQALLEEVGPMMNCLCVLQRQLRRARPGSANSTAFAATLDLLSDDLRQILDSPAAGWVTRAHRAEGYDTLQDLLDAVNKLREMHDQRSLELVEADQAGSAAVARQCHAWADALTAPLDRLLDLTGRGQRMAFH